MRGRAAMVLAVALAGGCGRRPPSVDDPPRPPPACRSDAAAIDGARVQMAGGNLHVALAAAERLVAACGSADALLLRADVLADLGLDDRALADYAAVARSGDRRTRQTAAGKVAAIRARPAARREATAAERDDALAFYRGGVNYRLRGQHAGSLALLRKSYALLPHPLTVVQIGLTHQAAGAEAEARRAFARAVALAELTRGGPVQPSPLAGHTGSVKAIAFSPDGGLLASAGTDRRVKIWDVSSGRELRTLARRAGYALAFSPDGRTLAAATASRLVKLWDPRTGALVRNLEPAGDGEKFIALSYEPAGAWLAAAGAEGTEIERWNPASGDAGPRLPVGPVTAIALHHGTVLAASAGRGVSLYAPDQGRAVVLPRTGTPVSGLAVSPDGQTLAVVAARAVELWAVGPRRQLGTLAHAEVTAVAWSGDGAIIATADAAGAVKLWDPAGRERRTIRGHTGRVEALVFAPDGRSLASAGQDTTIRLWDTDSGGEVRRFGGLLDGFTAVTFCGPGVLATGSGRAVRLWDLVTGGGAHTLAARPVEPGMLSCSTDGQTVAAATGTAVEVWRTDGRAPLATLPATATAPIEAALLAPAGDRVATLLHDGNLVVWEVGAGRESWRRLAHQELDAGDLAFAPGGDLLASVGRDDSIKLWDVTSGRKRRLLAAGDGQFTSLAIAGGTALVLAAAARSAGPWVWNPGDPEPARALAGGGRGPLALSPDGSRVAVADDNGVAVVDVRSGRTLHALDGHADDVVDVAFDPGGRLLATAGADRTIRLWSAATGAQLAVLVVGAADDWLVIAADGRVDGSAPGGRSLLHWQRGDAQLPGFTAWDRQHAAGVLAELAARPDQAPTLAALAGPPGPVADSEADVRVVTHESGLVILEPVRFARGSATLDPVAEVAADSLAALMITNPAVLLLELGGNTDDTEPAALAITRANLVRDHLVAMGVAAERVQAVGHGSTRPVDQRRTAAARAANRRVDTLIVRRTED